MKDNVFSGNDARAKMVSGIKKVRDAVAGTMGTAGSNAIIEAIESPGHLLTNDGYTIAQSIRLEDPIENMGRNVLLESISRSNKQSGDGSSTSTVLTAAVIEQGIANLPKAHAMEIKRSLEACLPIIEKSLDEQKKEIDIDGVGQVATISAEDPHIGAKIQEIYKHIGKDGIIHWDISKTFEDHYTIGKGITIEMAGYLSPYFCDLDEKTGQSLNQARWNKPKILITKEKITTAAVFERLFSNLHKAGYREVVVFCDEIEATVIPQLVQTRIVQGFKTMVIKMPTIHKDWWYEDLALATGAKIIDPAAGLTFETMDEKHLGTCDHITVTKDSTYLDGIADVSSHIAWLESDGSDDEKIRASRLKTKTARYFVGAPSDSALSYRRLKVEDAINASWNALHGGVVAGGGVALLKTIESLPKTVGGAILSEALQAPFKQILENAHFESDVPFDGIHGVNSVTGKVVDMYKEGIIDPLPVVKNCVRNAISVGGTVLTANTVVTLPRDA